MRLLKLYVKNFKRFAGDHTLEVDEQLVALVGPNEAGKSSLLDALDRLGSGELPHASDRTRLSAAECMVGGMFALDDDDRTAIAGIRGGERVRTIKIRRVLGDGEFIDLDESPLRDLEPRRRCRDALVAIADDPALDSAFSTSDEWRWDSQQFERALEILGLVDETLAPDQIAVLDEVANRLRAIQFEPDEVPGDDLPPERSAAGREQADLRDAAANTLALQGSVERRSTPWDEITQVLSERLPKTALFKPEDRQLESHYDLATVADPASCPPALANLARVAGLDLRSIHDMVVSDHRPHVEQLLIEANARIKERFVLSWRQARVFPHFTLDGTLQIYVSTEGNDFSYPAERSDGLRWFLALYSFLLSRQQPNLILLVDEAETHLHYDAQADLIDALMSQGIASKVVYSTHSVGCLPPDLGRGIRAVVPDRDDERSSIRNTYWWLEQGEDEKVGHIPLLFGMGASLLALTVPRYALIAEGPSDAILLPTLMCRLLTLPSLRYRVVPGLSEISSALVPRLLSHAGEVVCLVDGDSGGIKIARRLAKHGIPSDRVLSLKQIANNATVEDLVTATLLADAIRAEVASWGGTIELVVRR